MKRFDPQELCTSLLKADSEAEIESILNQYGLLNNPRYWRDLGDNPSNSSIVGSQQGEPDLALIEKITNSVDAVLLGEVKIRGINPEGKEAPISIKEATAKYIWGGGRV